MNRFLLLIVLCVATHSFAQPQIQHTKTDSLRVTELLTAATHENDNTNWMLYFGRKLKGVPYVAKTLEGNSKEQLIVNLRQLDCTTYVETVLALTQCVKNKKTGFADYCHYLRMIRYRDGKVGYTTRLHYFTDWISDNERMGFVKENTQPNSVFSARQTLDINFMSTHISLYPMLVNRPDRVKVIADSERALIGRVIPYIPKGEISDTPLFHEAIHDGDIIAICTNKAGLDTSHIGIAVWHEDGLHMLHASQLSKKVIEDPLKLSDYMQKHPSQKGVRVVRVMNN